MQRSNHQISRCLKALIDLNAMAFINRRATVSEAVPNDLLIWLDPMARLRSAGTRARTRTDTSLLDAKRRKAICATLRPLIFTTI